MGHAIFELHYDQKAKLLVTFCAQCIFKIMINSITHVLTILFISLQLQLQYLNFIKIEILRFAQNSSNFI